MISYWHPIEINDDGDAVIQRLVMWHAVVGNDGKYGWAMVKKTGTPLKGVKLGDNFKLSVDGKVIRDEKAIDAKLDLCTRLKKRSSKRVRVKPVDAFRV